MYVKGEERAEGVWTIIIRCLNVIADVTVTICDATS